MFSAIFQRFLGLLEPKIWGAPSVDPTMMDPTPYSFEPAIPQSELSEVPAKISKRSAKTFFFSNSWEDRPFRGKGSYFQGKIIIQREILPQKMFGLVFLHVVPQKEVLVIFLQETGEKCGEFSSFNFQGTWPQNFSRKILDMFYSAPNIWGLEGPTFSALRFFEVSKLASTKTLLLKHTLPFKCSLIGEAIQAKRPDLTSRCSPFFFTQKRKNN